MAINNHKETPLSHGRGAGGEGGKSSKSGKLPLHAGAEPHQFKYAKRLRQEMTEAEKALWEQIRAHRFLNLKFRRQHPILEFVVDFYCHELKLIAGMASLARRHPSGPMKSSGLSPLKGKYSLHLPFTYHSDFFTTFHPTK